MMKVDTLTKKERHEVQMALKSYILEDEEYVKTLDEADAKEVNKVLEVLKGAYLKMFDETYC